MSERTTDPAALPPTPSDGVVGQLATATASSFQVTAQQFVHRWAKTLGAQVEWQKAESPLQHFRTAISGLYLRGFDDIPCWLLPPHLDHGQFFGPGGRLRQTGILGTEEIPVVICPDGETESAAKLALPANRAVVLGPATLRAMLSSDSVRGRAVLTQVIRSQIHALRLQPFDTTRPVYGDMFFGRERELALLRYERESFLITGPSRIGKTSLINHYRYLLRRDADPRLNRSYYINLQPCAAWKEDEMARYFAMHFRSLPYTNEDIVFRGLRSFLFSVVAGAGGPIELILDEADAVCHTGLLLIVGEFCQTSGSRLIVVGRGEVRHYWRRQRASAFGRLRDERCKALDPDSAWSLFTKPIFALGLSLSDPEHVRAQVLQQTSRMPHLIQTEARAAVETAFITDAKVISASLLRRGRDSFADFSTLRSHLADLRDDCARLAAVEMLLEQRGGNYTLEAIGSLLARHSISLHSTEVAEICDDLVINCLLGWDENGYEAPRWDVCQTALRNPALLRAMRKEILLRLPLPPP